MPVSVPLPPSLPHHTRCRKKERWNSENCQTAEPPLNIFLIIERGISIPSTEVIMRLASALETTPNEFLIGTNSSDNAEWEDIADMLRYFDKKKFSDMAF